MDEFDGITDEMIDRFNAWLDSEGRELSLYATRRFVCAELDGESAAIRSTVADALYTTARQRIELPAGYPDAGTW
jgi:hypothetical protein